MALYESFFYITLYYITLQAGKSYIMYKWNEIFKDLQSASQQVTRQP